MAGTVAFSDDSTDFLSADAILSHLPDDFFGSIIIKEVTASTNDDAKSIAPHAKHGTVVIANAQTAARGRMGRSFFAPDGGVYMSVIIKPRVAASETVLITSAAAVAVCRAIESVADVKPEIKWVNDILIDGKKVCGILCEAVADAVIVGIGVNFCPQEFPAGVDSVAGYLFVEATVSRNVFIATVLKELLAVVNEIESHRHIAEYRSRSAVIGHDILYSENGMWHSAHAVDIDENGGLVVLDGEIQKVLVSGEVSVRIHGSQKHEINHM